MFVPLMDTTWSVNFVDSGALGASRVTKNADVVDAVVTTSIGVSVECVGPTGNEFMEPYANQIAQSVTIA